MINESEEKLRLIDFAVVVSDLLTDTHLTAGPPNQRRGGRAGSGLGNEDCLAWIGFTAVR